MTQSNRFKVNTGLFIESFKINSYMYAFKDYN